MNAQASNRSDYANYRLDIRDFCPIAEAKVEVEPLKVFIGTSNTGRSYQAILSYALNQCFGGDPLLFAARPRIPLFHVEGEIPPEVRGSLPGAPPTMRPRSRRCTPRSGS